MRRVLITDDGDEVMPDGPNLAKDAYPRVAENIKHRMADFGAIQHVRCLLKLRQSEGGDKADDVKDTTKPPAPDSVEEDL